MLSFINLVIFLSTFVSQISAHWNCSDLIYIHGNIYGGIVSYPQFDASFAPGINCTLRFTFNSREGFCVIAMKAILNGHDEIEIKDDVNLYYKTSTSGIYNWSTIVNQTITFNPKSSGYLSFTFTYYQFDSHQLDSYNRSVLENEQGFLQPSFPLSYAPTFYCPTGNVTLLAATPSCCGYSSVLSYSYVIVFSNGDINTGKYEGTLGTLAGKTLNAVNFTLYSTGYVIQDWNGLILIKATADLVQFSSYTLFAPDQTKLFNDILISPTDKPAAVLIYTPRSNGIYGNANYVVNATFSPGSHLDWLFSSQTPPASPLRSYSGGDNFIGQPFEGHLDTFIAYGGNVRFTYSKFLTSWIYPLNSSRLYVPTNNCEIGMATGDDFVFWTYKLSSNGNITVHVDHCGDQFAVSQLIFSTPNGNKDELMLNGRTYSKFASAVGISSKSRSYIYAGCTATVSFQQENSGSSTTVTATTAGTLITNSDELTVITTESTESIGESTMTSSTPGTTGTTKSGSSTNTEIISNVSTSGTTRTLVGSTGSTEPTVITESSGTTGTVTINSSTKTIFTGSSTTRESTMSEMTSTGNTGGSIVSSASTVTTETSVSSLTSSTGTTNIAATTTATATAVSTKTSEISSTTEKTTSISTETVTTDSSSTVSSAQGWTQGSPTTEVSGNTGTTVTAFTSIGSTFNDTVSTATESTGSGIVTTSFSVPLKSTIITSNPTMKTTIPTTMTTIGKETNPTVATIGTTTHSGSFAISGVLTFFFYLLLTL